MNQKPKLTELLTDATLAAHAGDIALVRTKIGAVCDLLGIETMQPPNNDMADAMRYAAEALGKPDCNKPTHTLTATQIMMLREQKAEQLRRAMLDARVSLPPLTLETPRPVEGEPE